MSKNCPTKFFSFYSRGRTKRGHMLDMKKSVQTEVGPEEVRIWIQGTKHSQNGGRDRDETLIGHKFDIY